MVGKILGIAVRSEKVNFGQLSSFQKFISVLKTLKTVQLTTVVTMLGIEMGDVWQLSEMERRKANIEAEMIRKEAQLQRKRFLIPAK